MIVQNELKAQNFFGIGLSSQYSQIVNISKDTLVPFGFSGAELNQNFVTSLVPHVHFRKTLGKKISLQTGLRYNRLNKNMSFSFYDDFFQNLYVDTLKIKLNYLTVPIRVNYTAFEQNDNSLAIGLGVNSNILLAYADNYQEIIPWEVLLNKQRYARAYASIEFSLFYGKIIKNNSLLNLELNVNGAATQFISNKRAAGIYKNLSPSSILQYSIGLHYYYKK
jgi:hypothetical protein